MLNFQLAAEGQRPLTSIKQLTGFQYPNGEGLLTYVDDNNIVACAGNGYDFPKTTRTLNQHHVVRFAGSPNLQILNYAEYYATGPLPIFDPNQDWCFLGDNYTDNQFQFNSLTHDPTCWL
ncbi:MAG: hypothetical protein ACYDBJ_20765 [Aggregatilineales bacterium]